MSVLNINSSLELNRENRASTFIDSHAQKMLNIFIVVSLTSAVAVFGMITNSINIFVFVKQGLKDGMTLSLFVLSCSDFLCLLFTCVFSLAPVIDLVEGDDAQVDWESLQVLFAWSRSLFADISIGVTLIIAVDRCLCVVLPLKFRDMVSLKRSLTLTSAMVVFTVVSYLPVFATHGLSWQQVGGTNRTRLYIWFSDVRPDIHSYSNIFTSLVVGISFQVIVFVCAVLMYQGMRHSRIFQARATRPGDEAAATNHKSRQVIKMVFLVSVILLLCNTPQHAFVIFLQIVDVDTEWEYYNGLVATLMGIVFTCTAINGSVNIFVYYNFSTSYRHVYDASVGCRFKRKEVK